MDEAILRTAVTKRFSWFVSKAFAHLMQTDFEDEPYARYICEMLEQLERGDIRRLLVNAPPRHLKTFICSVCFLAWCLGRNPALQVLLVSYNENFADDIVSPIRQLFKAAWFRNAFPKLRIAEQRGSVVRTTAGGSLRSASRSGTLTGHGADLVVIDDPHKIGDERRPQRLAEDVDHYKTTVFTRVNNPKSARYLVVAQRVHADDLSGRLLAEGDWTHVCLPLVAERKTTVEFGGGRWRRRVGTVPRPDTWPTEEVERFRRQLGRSFDAFFQQNPESR